MALQTVKVTLPEWLYEQVKQRAQDTNRSVEDELAAVVEKALITDDAWAGVPADIADEVEQLRFLDDEHLWRAARLAVPAEKSERMQALSQKRQAEGLTQVEQEETKQLQHLAQRVMLVRAEAAVLLQERERWIRTGWHPPAE